MVSSSLNQKPEAQAPANSIDKKAAEKKALEKKSAEEKSVVMTDEGADNDAEESGNSVEEVALSELEELEAAEGSAQGLFGGLGLAAGADVATTGGLAALSLLTGLGTGSNTAPPDATPPEFQVAGVTSSGLNIGPSADGSGAQGLSLTDTNVTVGGNKEAVATVSEVSLLDPSAPVPSGNPITVDAASQQLSADLGPVGQVALGLSPDPIPSSALSLVDGLSSGKFELQEVVGLDIPASVAGNEVPLTSTLTDGLTQAGDALTPVTDPVFAVLAGGLPEGGSNPLEGVPLVGDFINQGASALSDIPLVGPVATQLTADISLENLAAPGGDQPISDVPWLGPLVMQGVALLSGPSPVGELPVGSGTQIPSTIPELVLITDPAASAINSTADGQNPLVPVISALPL